jgi:hypothetical protein
MAAGHQPQNQVAPGRPKSPPRAAPDRMPRSTECYGQPEKSAKIEIAISPKASGLEHSNCHRRKRLITQSGLDFRAHVKIGRFFR